MSVTEQPPRGRLMESLDRRPEWGDFLEHFGAGECHALLRQAVINFIADELGRIVYAGEFGPQDREQIRKLVGLLDDIREPE